MDKNISIVSTAMQLASEIVIAYLAKGTIQAAELPGLVREIRDALLLDLPRAGHDPASAPAEADVDGVDRPAVAPAPVSVAAQTAELKPAVPVAESITPDFLISLEDGQRYRSLRRHLMAKYGMTPDQYRAKWSLPGDYPMVAPSYAKERSEVAKRTGLGRTGRPSPPDGGVKGQLVKMSGASRPEQAGAPATDKVKIA